MNSPPFKNRLEDFSTDGDLATHVERVVKALEKSGSIGLAHLVERLRAQVKPRIELHVPMGLIAEPDDHGNIVITDQPYTTVRFTHLVLEPETAKSYEMTFFQVANVHMVITSDPVPLETFSIEYLQDDKLAHCMAWKTMTIGPANRFTIAAALRKGFKPVPFRGLLWAETLVL
jgi:hypothetical protein